MAYDLDISKGADPDQLSQLEWIETTGTGGWASSTVCGMNTRKYHGLLVASDPKDPRRISQVSRMDETLVTPAGNFELAVVDYRDTLHPQGYRLLRSFSKDLFPRFTFQAGGITLEKTIAAIQGQNTVVVQFEVREAASRFTLRLNPFITCRDYHSLVHCNPAIHWDSSFQDGLWQANPYSGMPGIFIRFPGFSFFPKPEWYYNIHYRQEEARGMDHMEDQFTYGWFEKEMKQGDRILITLSSGQAPKKEGGLLLDQEQKRRLALVRQVQDPTERMLRLAADQFLIRTGSGSSRIIAGYHWFTSWGRDTMVSLRGLCISTGRTDDAREILLEFFRWLSEGMLPNRFPDQGEIPEYNTVDATLWLFVACHDYYQATGDQELLTGTLIPNLQSILDWHEKGTRYHIHEDSDGLLSCGQEGVQLTWMDARIRGRVITPRMGKPVEVNALWYNALMVFSEFLKMAGQKALSVKYQLKAATAKDRFLKVFWNPELNCLFDSIDGDLKDDAIRPNQLLAVSLPYPLLEGTEARQVLDRVTENLYTPRGIRSLAPEDPAYRGHYSGNQASRDEAYHEGTAWAWLLGSYVDAIMRVQGRKARTMARKVIEDFRPHFQEAGLLTVSEVFDGDWPHTPGGCIAQAWSVAELLRVYLQYKLKPLTPSSRK